MSTNLSADIESVSFEIAKQALDYFNSWRAGQVYISKFAFSAMYRRYVVLQGLESLLPLELFEFGRLYAFFCLVYPDGELPSAADIAVEFCNLVNA